MIDENPFHPLLLSNYARLLQVRLVFYLFWLYSNFHFIIPI
jgi:hypothetical protein